MTDIKRIDGPLSSAAAQALSAFCVGVAAEQRASHAAGTAFPVWEDGQVVLVHPNGSRRAGMEDGSEELG